LHRAGASERADGLVKAAEIQKRAPMIRAPPPKVLLETSTTPVPLMLSVPELEGLFPVVRPSSLFPPTRSSSPPLMV
jgi:hypothetical protein